MLIIRHASNKDLSALAEIERICFPASETADLKKLTTRFTVFPRHFLVAELNSRIIGFINGMVTDKKTIEDIMFDDATLHNPQGKYQSVFGLDVLPKYQHHGFAAELMKAFIRQAEQEKRRGVILTCKKHLLSYYEKFGYVNSGISASTHGGSVWYDMILKFDKNDI